MIALQRPDTMMEAVSKSIRDAIVRGNFAPGARLPEIALATALNTSRGTVREALRVLADIGLVDVFPRRGAFVSQLSSRQTWEITSLRALLEPYAARLALEASGSARPPLWAIQLRSPMPTPASIVRSSSIAVIRCCSTASIRSRSCLVGLCSRIS